MTQEDDKIQDKYYSIRLPKTVIALADEYLKKHPEYVSRSELIKEAIRMHTRKKE